jgi:hypothetical protein
MTILIIHTVAKLNKLWLLLIVSLSSSNFERYLKVSKIFLIPPVNFYYIINKLIILVSNSH